MYPAFLDDERQIAPARAVRTQLDDGSFTLRSPMALQPYARCVGEWLERWAKETPDALALAERSDGAEGWRSLTYAQLRRQVGAVGQSLLDRRLPAGRPIAILSDNAVDHAVLMLVAMHVASPPARCRAHMHDPRTAAACTACCRCWSPAWSMRPMPASMRQPCKAGTVAPCGCSAVTPLRVPGALPWEHLLAGQETPQVQQAMQALLPDDHAKYLLTSGSTGRPKVVINTHRTLCANQQMMAQAWRFLAHGKPVLVDWLPWSHTFGGNHNLNMVLCHGGTLYIDEGRPMPGLIDKTVRNLREVQPTMLFNVPRGFDMLLPFLEADDRLAADVLARMRLAFYAAAALAPSTWQRLQAVARRVRPAQPMWLTTLWGSIVTAPAVTTAHWHLEGAGCIGAPLPGLELKLVPNGSKLEMRVRGVSAFAGYRNAPRETAAAFDHEGFYRIGDAGYLVEAEQPDKGLVFNGRVAEDFKLSSGSWVSVGTLRVDLMSQLAPLVQDIVLTGHDRDEVGMLVFPSAAGAADAARLEQALQAVMRARRDAGAESSQCPTRATVMDAAPDADAGEITDKGYINQGAVLSRRAAAVQALYAHPAAPGVIGA